MVTRVIPIIIISTGIITTMRIVVVTIMIPRAATLRAVIAMGKAAVILAYMVVEFS